MKDLSFGEFIGVLLLSSLMFIIGGVCMGMTLERKYPIMLTDGVEICFQHKGKLYALEEGDSLEQKRILTTFNPYE